MIVDTCVWSLAFRRQRHRRGAPTELRALEELMAAGQAAFVGVIRQEILSGIPDELQYERLRVSMRSFIDLPVTSSTHELAASFSDRCRRAGVQGSPVDLLICAAASEHDAPIFTTDADFVHYQAVLGTRLWRLAG